MTTRLKLGAVTVDVTLKDIKNVHLSVYPPLGRVRVSAPSRMRIETIRVFVIAKLDWIKKQQKKLREQAREAPREYLERESHYVWGKRYLLKVTEEDQAPSVELRGQRLLLSVRPRTTKVKRQEIVEEWYRGQIREAAGDIIAKWKPVIGVNPGHIFVQRMRTKWGSCNHSSHNIRLNTDLAKKPLECLEYILVHEMVHLLEHTHNARFIALMDRFMPKWQYHRQALNRLPVRHEDWGF